MTVTTNVHDWRSINFIFLCIVILLDPINSSCTLDITCRLILGEFLVLVTFVICSLDIPAGDWFVEQVELESAIVPFAGDHTVEVAV